MREEPLATWTASFRGGAGEFEAKGVVERKLVGKVTTSVSKLPTGLDVNIIEARPPQIQLTVGSHEIEILDGENQPFIRASSDGVWGRRDSADYQAHLRASRLPEDPGTGWVPMAGSGAGWMTWADQRLDYSANIPTEEVNGEPIIIHRWSIPITVDGRPAEIAGTSDWISVDPPNLEPPEPGKGFWQADRSAYIAALALTAAVAASYLTARLRRRGK